MRWQRYTRRTRKLTIKKTAKSWFRSRSWLVGLWAGFSIKLLIADRRLRWPRRALPVLPYPTEPEFVRAIPQLESPADLDPSKLLLPANHIPTKCSTKTATTDTSHSNMMCPLPYGTKLAPSIFGRVQRKKKVVSVPSSDDELYIPRGSKAGGSKGPVVTGTGRPRRRPRRSCRHPKGHYSNQ